MKFFKMRDPLPAVPQTRNCCYKTGSGKRKRFIIKTKGNENFYNRMYRRLYKNSIADYIYNDLSGYQN